MRRIKLVLLAFLLVPGGMPASPAQAAPFQRVDSVRDLWLDISLGPPLVDWFNRVARPDDIARVENVRQIDLLERIIVGRKLVVFQSAAEAERFVPIIADRIDIIGYNLEHRPGNSSEEQEDPVGNVKRMHDLAQKYDLALAFGPDHSFALSDGVAVAPYVDIFVLQVQRVQTEPATVLDFALPLMRQLRQANPNLRISVQVRTEGDVVAIVDLIDCMKDGLDGVSVLTSPETVETAEALVTELRTRKTAKPCPEPTPEATPVSVASVAPAVSAASAPEIKREESPDSTQDTGLSCPLLIVSALIAGGAIGGLTAALICASRSKPVDE